MIQTRQVPLGTLVEYAGNAKIHDEANIEAIMASIRRFGNCDPIGVWTNEQGELEIVEGHGRKMALEALGYEYADVIMLDHLTDEERRAYTLAHNQTTLMTDFDLDALELELEALSDFGMEDFGFDVSGEDDEPVEVVEDEVPEDAPALCKAGDVWQLGRHRLMCGDSTDADAVARLMDGVRASLLLTDPPYGINRDKGFGGEWGFAGAGKPIKRREYKDEWDAEAPSAEVFDLITSVANKSIIWGGNFFTDKLPVNGFWLVWDKKNTMPTFGDCELAWTDIPRKSVKKYEVVYNGLIGKEKDRYHPTQKPVKLIAAVLQDFSDEDDVVLDVFGGSGTTLVAAEQLGRTCYMMELDPHYCDVIIERWQNLTGGTAVRCA